MRAPPQVSYPLGRARLRHTLTWLLLLGTLGAVVAVDHSQPNHELAVLMLVLLLVPLALTWRASPAGRELQWDGEQWHLLGPEVVSGQVHLVLDVQRALLLRWTSPLSGSDPATSWLWIEQSANPVIWMDVRRAVYWNAH